MRRSFEYQNDGAAALFRVKIYEYMNKLSGSGVWAPAQTPLPHSPPGKGGEWGVGSAPHSLGGKVRVFIPQGKTCPIFLSILPNKSFMLELFKKNLSLKSQAEDK